MTVHDDFQCQFLSELLAARTGELAECAACDLLAAHPGLAEAYQPSPRLKWREHFAGRLGDLAAAVRSGRAEVMAEQVAWSRGAFAARGVPVEHLRMSLRSLGETLSRAVSPEDAPMVAWYIGEGLRVLEGAAAGEGGGLAVGTGAGHVAAEYLRGVLEGDRIGAARVVLDAVKSGLGVREAYLGVLAPVQEELGRLWHLGELSVAEEHAATAATQLVMANLLMTAGREPHDGRVAVAAAVRSNTHEIGVRMVGDLLELAGWRVVSLGGDVPAEDLASACGDFGAHLVALSAAMPAHLRAMEEAIGTLRRMEGRAPAILVGGRALAPCPELWSGLGADAYGATAGAGVEAAGRLVPVGAAGPA